MFSFPSGEECLSANIAFYKLACLKANIVLVALWISNQIGL